MWNENILCFIFANQKLCVFLQNKTLTEIVVDRYDDRIVMSNPGTMLVSMEGFWEGGYSVCRNPLLQKMFVFVGVGEKAGSGANIISVGWRDNGWQVPTLAERQNPNRVETTLLIADLIEQQKYIAAEESGMESGMKSGLKTTQEQIIMLIKQNPQISITAISETLKMAKSGIAKQIKSELIEVT
jgi:predicted HTH transcriptional regulator